MKRAFTLIELLVVIAIIAILAAILFPVFAQAKAAAKAAASLSNDKQLALAVIMYEGDANDMVPPAACWDTGNDPVQYGSVTVGTWAWMTQPYIKNGQLFQDPLAPSESIPTGWTAAAVLSIDPTYGYNYDGLSPYGAPAPAAGTTAPPNPGAGAIQYPISATAPARPADMVMIGSKYSSTEAAALNPTEGVAFSFNPITAANPDNGPLLTATIDAPNCGTLQSWCATNWGEGGQLQSTSQPWWELSDAAGGNTGGMTFRAMNTGIATFMDGHAKKQTPGFLAQGTNYYQGIPQGNLVENNPNIYHWVISP